MIRTGILALVMIFQLSGDFNKEIPEWEIEAPNYIHWIFPTITGNLLYKGTDGIHGLDPETREILWTKNEFARVPMQNIRQVPNTPFYEILGLENPKPQKDEKTSVKSFAKGLKDNFVRGITDGEEIYRVHVFDPLSGKIIFDSKDLDIEFINKKKYIKDLQCFIFEGLNEKSRVFGMVDVISGEVLWIKDKPIKLAGYTFNDNLDARPDTQGNLLVSYKDSLYRIEKLTGNFLWSHSLKEIPRYVILPTDNKHFYSSTKGGVKKFEIQSGKFIQEFRPSSGDFQVEKNLSNPFQTLEKLSSMSASGDKLLIRGNSGFFFLDPNEMKPLNTQSSIFESNNVTNVLKQDDGKYLVYLKDRGNGKLSLSLADQNCKVIWKKLYEIPGEKTKLLEYTSNGIVIITDQQADIIDLNSGKSKLRSKLTLKKELPIIIKKSLELEKVAFIHNNEVVEIDMKSGEVKKMVKNLKFKGDDQDKIPNQLEFRENGYFITSNQNILFINYNGTIRYQKFFKRPGMSEKSSAFFTRFGSLALGYIFREQAQNLTQAMYQTGMLNDGEYLEIGLYDMYYGGTGSAVEVSNLAVKAFTKVRERTNAFQGENNFQLILSRLNTGGNGFLKIDKDSGEELQSIRLDDKTPTFLVDDILEGMYYVTPDNKKMQFYSLK